MDRRHFLASISTLLAAHAGAQTPQPPCLLIAGGQLPRMREAAKSGRVSLLEKLAGSALAAGPWSVTAHRPTGLKLEAGEHDYFSEGPYWWPDPKNPNGPYIRKDGRRNPARFDANHSDLGKMGSAVLALGMGAALLAKAGCADRAALILNTWFLDAKTRMNPNLEYGQAVRGINTGRGTGLIDTRPFIDAIQGVMLLEATGALDTAIGTGMRDWFRQFSTWMTTSQKGLDEKKSGNNHATWWTAQVAAYAIFTRDEAMQKMAWDHYRNYLVPKEIQPDGSCPKEEARTDSLSYSSMNLDAFSVICRLGGTVGQNLWHYRAPNGGAVETACNYMAPFVVDPSKWKKEQINPYSPAGHFFPGLAGVGLPSADLLAVYRKLPRAESPWIQLIDLVIATS